MSKEIYRQYDAFKSGLQANVLQVLFEKSDKSTREMLCTLNSRLITEYGCPLPQESSHDIYTGNLRVFDLQKLESRMIPLRRVKTYVWLPLDTRIPDAILNLTI